MLILSAERYGDRCVQGTRKNKRTELRSIAPVELAATVRDYETSDQLLVIDPIRWPISDFDVKATVNLLADYGGVTHAIAVGADGERTRERVESDDDGCVKRVQRLYNRVNWPEAATTNIFLSVVPIPAVQGIRFTSLADLRSGLSAHGVLSRDLPISVNLTDVTTETGLLALNDRFLTHNASQDTYVDFSKRNDDVFVGSGCRIHPSARLIGPVIVHADVRIGANVTIIGPSIVGAGACIEKGAVITRSILAPGTDVAAGTALQHRVLWLPCSSSIAGSTPQSTQMPVTINVPAHRKPASGNADSRGDSLRHRKVQLAIKRVLDVVLSSLGLAILSPLLLIVALLIKLESRGAVLFSHRRERKGGAEFPCFKFRTMFADAHRQQRELYKNNEVDGPQFKLHSDPRVTHLGRWLRITNIDELPQLINVFLGHMSLVGPRPSPFRENQICVPWRRARLSVQPGITGLWQVCRSEDRTRGDFHEWIYYDIAYVRHISVWLDVKILLATVLTCGGRWSVPLSWMIREAKQEQRLYPTVYQKLPASA
ncbi:MAG: sugar transferase [Planctomycetes bacterium]|nr:sugar transferase [Planctomycetota bacterium]